MCKSSRPVQPPTAGKSRATHNEARARHNVHLHTDSFGTVRRLQPNVSRNANLLGHAGLDETEYASWHDPGHRQIHGPHNAAVLQSPQGQSARHPLYHRWRCMHRDNINAMLANKDLARPLLMIRCRPIAKVSHYSYGKEQCHRTGDRQPFGTYICAQRNFAVCFSAAINVNTRMCHVTCDNDEYDARKPIL